MKINCLIIDDEPSSQDVLKTFIKDVDFLHLVSVCNNAIEALDTLNAEHVDLLFLDVNMPKISGLTFYKSLQSPPSVIFTTAYTKYAVEGFEVNAIDYLLKPFSFNRFLTAVNKFRNSNVKFDQAIKQEFLLIKSNKVLHKVLMDAILFVEAFGDYVKVYLLDQCLVTHSTFINMTNALPDTKFIQTHKSFAVNIDKINSIVGNQVHIQDKIVPIGQKFKSNFLSKLGEQGLN